MSIFMSDTELHYSYGNKGAGEQEYKSQPFSKEVKIIMQKLNSEFGTAYNACFLNKYDDQYQHLGWHADDFKGMDIDHPIAVVSYGAEREIWFKDKQGFHCPTCAAIRDANPFSCAAPPGHYWVAQGCETCGGTEFIKAPPNGKQPLDQRILLKDGSLFIMPRGFQKTHLHRIPKHDKPCGWRISLTFRRFIN